MSINRISQPSSSLPIDQAAGATAATSAQAPFQVGRTQPAVESASGSAFDQLQRGAIDRNQYIEARLQQAVDGLPKSLEPEKVSFIRETLRAQLDTDPMLADLLRRISPTTER